MIWGISWRMEDRTYTERPDIVPHLCYECSRFIQQTLQLLLSRIHHLHPLSQQSALCQQLLVPLQLLLQLRSGTHNRLRSAHLLHHTRHARLLLRDMAQHVLLPREGGCELLGDCLQNTPTPTHTFIRDSTALEEAVRKERRFWRSSMRSARGRDPEGREEKSPWQSRKRSSM